MSSSLKLKRILIVTKIPSDLLLCARGAPLCPMKDNSSNDTEVIDFERVLFHALVNEGKHTKVFSTNRQNFIFNEKQLRDAAAAEVLKLTGQSEDFEGDKYVKKRKQMSSEEKSKQIRDRNREHAKNTRLRKKAYVAKLKEMVDQLSHQRNVELNERVLLGKRIHHTQVLCKNAVRLFLSYRAASVQDYSKWATILDENFVLTIPFTPYRAFNRRDVVSSQRVIKGIGGVIADVASVALTVESVGQGTPAWLQAIRRGQSCRMWYDLSGRNDIMGAGDVVMCKFVERSEGHIGVGAPCGFAATGMMQCRFNKANKIVSADIVFDVMSCMQQIQRATLSSIESTLVVPASLESAMTPSSDARMIVSATAPHPVVFVNQPWTRFFSDGNEGALQQENWFIGREASACIILPSTSDPTPMEQKLRVVLGQAATGIPSRIAFSRTRRDGSIVLCYTKLIPVSREEDDTENYILFILHEYEVAKCTSPRESESVQAWGRMGMLQLPSSAQDSMGGRNPEGEKLGGAMIEHPPAAGGMTVPLSCFQRAPHLSAPGPPAWLIQQTIMEEEEACHSSLPNGAVHEVP